MAKRFTDTDKWKREFFYDLKPHAKLTWLYLLDQCDHAGIWPRNFKLMSEQLGLKVDHNQLIEWFGPKVILFDGDKYFIPSFFEFQYGASKEGFKAKASALKTLQALGLATESGEILTLTNSSEQSAYTSGQLVNCPSIGTSNIKSNSKSIIGGVGDFDFEALYTKYPKKVGKAEAFKRLKAQIKSQSDYEAMSVAIDRYVADCAKTNRILKDFSTFVSPNDAQSWREWLNEETSSVVDLAAKQKADWEAETAKKMAAYR